VFHDGLVLKMRDGDSVQRRACYLASAINIDGEGAVLDTGFQANERAKFWIQVLTDLKQRGVQDVWGRQGAATRLKPSITTDTDRRTPSPGCDRDLEGKVIVLGASDYYLTSGGELRRRR
jgi:hypothetical protein